MSTLDPKCVEVEISATTGGKVQIVQFKLSNDFAVTYSEKYTIPAHWDQARFEQWRDEKAQAIKEKVDALAQAEQDNLLAASDWYQS